MKKVPFYPNTKDNLHCYQACLRMVLKYFLPNKSFTYKQLDVMTGFKRDLWTWPIRGLISLLDLGFTIKVIEDFDYVEFTRIGSEYIRKLYGPVVAQEQEIHSNVKQAQKDLKKYLDRIDYERRIPDIFEIKRFVNDGYLVGCNINAKSLRREKGYEGHFVVVFGVTSTHVTFHDPGFPAEKNKNVTMKKFICSWSYPSEKANNLVAFKL